MRFLLDTNICIHLIRQKPAGLRQRFEAHPIAEAAVSAVTVAELQYGVSKSRAPAQNQAALAEFLLPLAILPFDDQAAVTFGSIQAILEKQGRVIGPYDLLIAAQALCHGLTMVTNNTREFSRVPGLLLEDWTSGP